MIAKKITVILKKYLIISVTFVSFCISLLIYQNTLKYGFDYDDYHQIRPYTLSEVLNSFTGQWDSMGIEREFFRPLTIAFYAIRFELFNYNAYSYHLLSLVMFSILALLFFKILNVYSENLRFSLLGMVIFISYPYFAHSTVVWATNQMHLLIILCFLVSWYWMIRVKSKPNGKLYFLIVLQVIAVLIKEDGFLLLPTLFIITTAENILVKKRIHFSRSEIIFWLNSVILLLILVIIRQISLYNIGGYHTFSLSNIPKTLLNVIFLSNAIKGYTIYHLAITKFAQFFVVFISCIGLILFIFFKHPKKSLYFSLFMTGISIIFTFNLLTVFSTKIYQWHMQSLGHSINITVCLYFTSEFIQARSIKKVYRYFIMGFFFIGILSLMSTSHILSTTFSPFSYQTIHHDKKVLKWGNKIPERHRQELLKKQKNPFFNRFDTNWESHK